MQTNRKQDSFLGIITLILICFLNLYQKWNHIFETHIMLVTYLSKNMFWKISPENRLIIIINIGIPCSQITLLLKYLCLLNKIIESYFFDNIFILINSFIKISVFSLWLQLLLILILSCNIFIKYSYFILCRGIFVKIIFEGILLKLK